MNFSRFGQRFAKKGLEFQPSTVGVEARIPGTDEPSPLGRSHRWAIRVGMVVAVLGWLWPVGVGGQIPVGGDATQFSMGLMAFLRSSLVAARWPLWNDLWGFGFPALAESQMGVYYPPHWGYALISTETAYAASLLAHFVWGALGAAWMARRFGVSEIGSALSGFAWATSGFFLIHLPHQWAYTVGAWMPWAWGLAWQTVRANRNPLRPAARLAAVLAVQILPGHFQMAFVTEVGVAALALAGAGRGRFLGMVAVGLALGAMLPLAAAQLVPTEALARLSGGNRGFEYLSGFAASPVHLVSYVAPGLFHRSPLWRPLAWDLFHTSPEEYLGYVGLVPLLLAARSVAAGGRSRPEVRALFLVGLLTLILSLGPYFPGFRWLITLPGFSFFRAPARWSLGTSLALAVLAGFELDSVRRVGWTRRAVLGFALASVLVVGLVVGGFELALGASRGGGLPAVAGSFDRALRTFPWAGQPGEPSFRSAMAAAYRPQDDLRVQAAQARLDPHPFPPGGMVLARERWEIYARELSGTAAVLLALTVVGTAFARRPRSLAAALLVLTGLDVIGHGQLRPFDLGPARSLVAQSPVLTRLAAEGRGFRTLDPAQNLFLVAGGDSAQAYRTLNLPSPGAWLALGKRLDPNEPKVKDALVALGIDARVLDPLEHRAVGPDWNAGGWGRQPAEVIRDPTLAGWLYGADFARLNRLADFRWAQAATPAVRAWRVDDVPMIAQPIADPLVNLRRAAPLLMRSPSPGQIEVEFDRRGDAPSGPSWVVVSQTYDPEWVASWAGPTDQFRPAEVVRTPEGWQAVAVPALGAGAWTLRLDYDGKAARLGLIVSVIAWTVWLGLVGWFYRADRRVEAFKVTT